jgi:hypothetical protein
MYLFLGHVRWNYDDALVDIPVLMRIANLT